MKAALYNIAAVLVAVLGVTLAALLAVALGWGLADLVRLMSR